MIVKTAKPPIKRVSTAQVLRCDVHAAHSWECGRSLIIPDLRETGAGQARSAGHAAEQLLKRATERGDQFAIVLMVSALQQLLTVLAVVAGVVAQHRGFRVVRSASAAALTKASH
jgi:hypothetical protein